MINDRQDVGHAPSPVHQSQEHIEGEDARWTLSRDLFVQAVDLGPTAREVFLTKHCVDDPELLKELQTLLAADATGPLTGMVGEAVEATTTDRRHELIAAVVGSYKLVSVLGHGGAGTVYLAERVDSQYSAEVAIKVVESAALHPDVLRRFRAERQILASLNHVYIGRLLDAGETAQGLPYLVMEYVRGEPIDKFCDSSQLNIDARLRLFLKVCEAVQFAHQNLIVHRDLKPANILVTSDGTPKLLDFGIAKLLDTSDAAAGPALTRINDRMLTAEYASPEQILGKAITTSSDLYALGVLLYELLTGLRPYDVASSDQFELERSICLIDPPKPSTTVRSENGLLAAARSLTPAKLRGQLEGDIDAIVLRALRKEPERRYASVEQFAADVQRHLERQPVAARQGNWLYYSQRFLRRHTIGVTAGVFATCLIIAFTINTALQAKHVAAERDRAEIVSSFMLDVFAAADPFVAQGREVTARELLDKAGAKINRELDQQPEVHARLLEAIGLAYYSQGQSARAIPYLQDALRLLRRIGDNGARTANTLYVLGVALRDSGSFSESEQAFAQAMVNFQQRHQEESPEYAKLLKGMGWLEHSTGNIDKAERYFRQSLDLSRKLYGERRPEVADLLSNLSTLMEWKQNLPAAEQLAQQAVGIYHTSVSETHPDRVVADALLGEVLFKEGKIQEAGLMLEHALAGQRVTFGARSSRVLRTLGDLSDVRLAQGRQAEAEELSREALKLAEELFGERHYEAGYVRTTLADVLMKRGHLQEAEKEARLSLEILSAALPADHQYIGSAEYQLGLILTERHQFSEARKKLEDSMHRWERSGAPPWRAARSESVLGEVLLAMGERREAEPHLLNSYQVLAKDLGTNDSTTRAAQARLDHLRASLDQSKSP